MSPCIRPLRFLIERWSITGVQEVSLGFHIYSNLCLHHSEQPVVNVLWKTALLHHNKCDYFAVWALFLYSVSTCLSLCSQYLPCFLPSLVSLRISLLKRKLCYWSPFSFCAIEASHFQGRQIFQTCCSACLPTLTAVHDNFKSSHLRADPVGKVKEIIKNNFFR